MKVKYPGKDRKPHQEMEIYDVMEPELEFCKQSRIVSIG